MVQRRAARYTMTNYHNTSSVNTMIDTLGQPTLAERRLNTRLTMFYKITHCLIAIPTDILVPADTRLRKHHLQSYQHIQTFKDTYKWSFVPHTIIQWNRLPQHTVQSTTIDILREQLTPTVLYPLHCKPMISMYIVHSFTKNCVRKTK